MTAVVEPVQQVRVTIAGTNGTVKVKLAPGATVSDVLQDALGQLGNDTADLERLAPVVDGEDAELTDQVQPDAHVSAAPNVANG